MRKTNLVGALVGNQKPMHKKGTTGQRKEKKVQNAACKRRYTGQYGEHQDIHGTMYCIAVCSGPFHPIHPRAPPPRSLLPPTRVLCTMYHDVRSSFPFLSSSPPLPPGCRPFAVRPIPSLISRSSLRTKIRCNFSTRSFISAVNTSASGSALYLVPGGLTRREAISLSELSTEFAC